MPKLRFTPSEIADGLIAGCIVSDFKPPNPQDLVDSGNLEAYVEQIRACQIAMITAAILELRAEDDFYSQVLKEFELRIYPKDQTWSLPLAEAVKCALDTYSTMVKSIHLQASGNGDSHDPMMRFAREIHEQMGILRQNPVDIVLTTRDLLDVRATTRKMLLDCRPKRNWFRR